MTTSISVCVPAFDAARTLEATLHSILDEDVDLDVVVLDNATTDGTAEIARSFDDPRLRVVRNDRVLDIGDNWNRAVAESIGELVKIVCADDLVRPGTLTRQAEMLKDPRIAITSAKFDVIGEAGEIRERGLGIPGLDGIRTAQEVFRTVVRRGPADFGPTAAAMFRRRDFERLGGFRGDLVFPMDIDLFARVTTFGSFFGMTECAAAWRDSTFNLCSRTSSLSKLTDMLRFQHRLAEEYPDLVSGRDVWSGDIRLARAALGRLAARTRRLVTERPRC
jgi:glycosyltransferase involved in cell wall biosynthesis